MNILNNTEAVRLLQDGCRRLELPYYTATELVKFLQVKRVHDSCLSDKARPDRKLSPGAALDRLWHWMLLNTKVSRAVHQLIGGEVEHIGTDEEDLNDHDKMLNRLYALNLLEISGFAPIVTLWQAPGTLMDSVEKYSVTNGPDLYFTPTTDESEQGQMMADLWQAMAPGSTAADADHGTNCQQKPDMTVITHHDPPVWHDLSLPADDVTVLEFKQLYEQEQGLPASQQQLVCCGVVLSGDDSLLQKDYGVQRGFILRVIPVGQPAPSPDPNYNITIKTLTGQQHVLNGMLGPWMYVAELKQMVYLVDGTPPDMIRLIVSGTRLENDRTLSDYNICSGAMVHKVLRLCGC